MLKAFMREVLPDATAATRRLAGELIKATLSAVGKEFSETPRTVREIARYSDAMADMFCAYLTNLARTEKAPSRARAQPLR